MSGALGQGSYTRTEGAPRTGRDATFPRFHMHPRQDDLATAAQGRPIFVNEERVQIIQPGNPNQPVMLVNDEHRQRWPDQYAAFRRGEDHVANGTPLEQWPVLSRAQVLEMKAIDLHTVEQCAGLTDLAIQRIGMGGLRIRELAKAYLDEAEQMAVTTEAIARAERAEARIGDMERQTSEMRTMMDQMHGELMALRNSHHPIATYVPGMHDPMQSQSGVAPVAPIAASSLDGLAAPRRGRPPGSRTSALAEAVSA